MNWKKLKMGIIVPLVLLQLNLYAQVPDNVVAGGRIYEWFAAGKWRDIGEVLDTLYPPGTVHCDPANPTAVVDVLNPATGKTWMDRNLGASQVATSMTDAASYGDLYQWGRLADGHQCRTSPTTTELSSSDVPGHGDFILTTSSPPFDWRSPQNNNLWQGVNGVNNPCPIGYRIPTVAELDAERLSWISNNAGGAFASPLKFSLAGSRNYTSTGNIIGTGTDGSYWSSSVNNSYAIGWFTQVPFTFTNDYDRASGNSVRCIKAEIVVGEIGTLDCAGAVVVGSLSEGVEASGVTATVNYTGGNGGTYESQSLSSTGVTGLTATLPSGTFNSGSGSILYSITGTPSSAGTASFALSLGGQSCTLTIPVGGSGPSIYPPGTVHCDTNNPTAVVDVLNPATGKTWMDRNLGASQVATSMTDAASYGDLYQWGRLADGHQCRTSPMTTQLSSSDVPGHGDFILAPNSPFDWRSPQNDNLWQGVNGVNNPCPIGYKVPTQSELDDERLSWSSNNAAGAFASPLKLSLGGWRSGSNNELNAIGTFGFYWSSTISGTLSLRLLFLNGNSLTNSGNRNNGYAVRCIKAEIN
jgi:uncharacterized protein (TIGR02145 family)